MEGTEPSAERGGDAAKCAAMPAFPAAAPTAEPTAPPGARPGAAAAATPAAAPAAPLGASPGAPRPVTRRLVLIGAGHVFDIRRTIRDAVVAYQPDRVFLELDRGRLEGLLARDRGEAPREGTGFVQKRLMALQQGVAAMYGAEVGGEMLGAVDGARLTGATLATIDDPADATVRKALREMTLRERLRLGGMLVAGGARALVPRRRDAAKREVEGELARYERDPAGVLGEMAAKFPTIHRVLIDERDEAMARRIRAGMRSCEVGVAVLGDGHLEGLLRRLADLEPVVHRLADVREGRLPRRLVATGSPTSVGFSVRGRT